MTHTRQTFAYPFIAAAMLVSSSGSGCYQEARTCADGRICPLGSECAAADNACISDGCGNGALDRGEECDDGNIRSGDGCSTTCRRELTAGGAHTCVTLPDDNDPTNTTIRCWGLNENGQLGRSHRANVGDDELALLDGVRLGDEAVKLAAGENNTCALLASGAVRCWGTSYNATDPAGNVGVRIEVAYQDEAGPAVNDSVKQLAVGGSHTCALLHSGAVRCWGNGDEGQLGYGNPDSIDHTDLPRLAGDVNIATSPAVNLAAGREHTCALLMSGAVHCWGKGSAGRLGYGNEDNVGDDEPPAKVGAVDVGSLGDVEQLAAGSAHTCALFTSGAVRCWGSGYAGRLGYGNENDIGDDELPASAGNVDVGGSVQQLVASGSHTCALLDAGTVRCWGEGRPGRLGYGNIDDIGDDEPPSSAGDVDVGGRVADLAAASSHTCALLTSGAVRCWGSGGSGKLGYGRGEEDIGDNEPPASVGDVDVGGPVKELVTGGSHTCALLHSGAVRCWGHGSRLGYGNDDRIGDDEVPGIIFGISLGAAVSQVVAGSAHTCALAAGAVHCWGRGREGQLGHGTRRDLGAREDPRSAGNVELGGPVQQIAAGDAHTCALMRSGAIRCWGSGAFGQLGYGHTETIGAHEPPGAVAPLELGDNSVQVVQIVAGARHTCALMANGYVYCWGSGESGQLGHGGLQGNQGPLDLGDDEHPAAAGPVPIGGPVAQLAAGGSHTCALLDARDVRCWGLAASGQLGHGNTDNIGDDEHPEAPPVVPIGAPVAQLAAGAQHTCALLTTGALRCWGAGESGQLGYGNTDNIGDDEPASAAGDVALGGNKAVVIAAGDRHTCATVESGATYCWGLGESGRLGYGPLGALGASIGDDETPASAGPLPTQ